MFAVWSFYAFWAFLHNNIFLVVFILKVDLSTFVWSFCAEEA